MEQIRVACYAGYEGEETPRSFAVDELVIEVLAVLDRWRTPRHRCFRVRTSSAETCVLRQDVESEMWELV